MRLAASTSILGSSPPGATDFSTSDFYVWSIIWSFTDVGFTELPQALPLVAGAWEAWKQTLSRMAKARKAQSISAFCMSSVPRSLSQEQWDYIFLNFHLLLIYLLKPLLLPVISLTSFNSSWALAFPVPTLHVWAMTLYSSWAAHPCFCLVCCFLFTFELTQVFPFSYSYDSNRNLYLNNINYWNRSVKIYKKPRVFFHFDYMDGIKYQTYTHTLSCVYRERKIKLIIM